MTCYELQLTPQPAGLPEEVPARVLIVDDDDAQTEILAMRLGRLGFRTLTAASGASGLRQARQERPDLVVLDVRLPDADGMEICEQLTDDPATCMIPVIILTGMERPDIVRCARQAGCRFFVRKPYDPNALLLLIQSALRQGQEWAGDEAPPC